MQTIISNQFPIFKKTKLKLKKAQILTVCHSEQWFINRLGKQIFHRVKTVNETIRSYVTIQSISHAQSLYVHQNISGKRYYH